MDLGGGVGVETTTGGVEVRPLGAGDAGTFDGTLMTSPSEFLICSAALFRGGRTYAAAACAAGLGGCCVCIAAGGIDGVCG